jgi:SecD/SecF fusion protein
MQNKGAIQVFAILLALACIWSLSFTFVTSNVERKIHAEAGDSVELEQAMLDSMKTKKVFLGYTYEDCKKREINLGLDLKGGMNVTLEVSVPELLKAMTNDTKDSAFNLAIKNATEIQKTSPRNYVDIFVEEFDKVRPGGNLASPSIFGHKDQGLIRTGMTREQVVEVLKKESNDAIQRTFEVLNARIDQFGVTQPNIQLLQGTNRILVELPGVKDPQRVQQLLQAEAKLEFYETYENSEVYPLLEKIDAYLAKMKIVGDPADTNVAIIDTLNPDSQTVVKDTTGGKDTLNKDTTIKGGGNMGGGMTDLEQEKLHPLFFRMQFNFYKGENDQQFLSPGPMIGISAAKDTALVNKYLRMPDVAKMLPKEIKLRWTNKALGEEGSAFGLIALKTLKGKPVLDGDVISDASFEPDDQRGGFRITMKMNSEGSNEWATITARNAPTGNGRGRSIAIVLDDKVYSYPTVEGAIKGGISTITGSFTSDEAKSLAAVLKAGKLPTPANIVEQAVVGPSLGKKAINAGVFSLIAAFIVILIYMMFYYGKAGIVADISLLGNVFFLFGTLAALGATLTLPGIAGIVLTLGMAVDANVLIFERIKEELRHGKRLKIALEDGYKRALSSIIDSNLTTIIIAIILMIFGAGPVKGFAVILFVGILTSMFSAIFLSRLIFESMLKRNMNISFSTKPTENFMRSPKINFVGRRKIFYVISGLVILAGVASFALKGFNLGIDLKGGRSYTVVLDNKDASVGDLTDALSAKFGSAPVVKFYGSNDRVKLITKYKVEQTDSATEKEIDKMIYEAVSPMYKNKISFADFANKDNDIGLVESYIVGPTVASDVAVKSIWAVALSLVMIFLYVFFRFKGWYFGLGALLALIHDVIIVLAVFSIFDGILPINLELDQAIIAAVLTVIGYSINDTVIIFDRIREYLSDGKKGDRKTLINSALNSTLSRTLNTSFTVFLVLIISFIFGGDSVKGFAFAILIGVVVGTYSSICIATPIVIDLKKDDEPAPAKK